MNDFNEIFRDYPDYDVFDDNRSEIGRKYKTYRNDEFLEYDKKRDFRNNHKTYEKESSEQDAEHSIDYRDDYGVYRVYEDKVRNYATIFFFPLVMVWLESVLRLACGQELIDSSMIFVVLFSLSFSGLLTIVCTFFGERANRVIVNILAIALSVLYCIQIVHLNLSGSFLSVSQYIPSQQSLAEVQAVMDTMSDKVYFLIACFVPSILQLFLGKFIFPFRRTPVPAKICLLLASALLFFSAVTVINFDKNSSDGNYVAYYQSENLNEVQEKFGLITMEIKDISN